MAASFMQSMAVGISDPESYINRYSQMTIAGSAFCNITYAEVLAKLYTQCGLVSPASPGSHAREHGQFMRSEHLNDCSTPNPCPIKRLLVLSALSFQMLEPRYQTYTQSFRIQSALAVRQGCVAGGCPAIFKIRCCRVEEHADREHS